jgi:hypothetical protein
MIPGGLDNGDMTGINELTNSGPRQRISQPPASSSDAHTGGGELRGAMYKATWGRIFAHVYDAAFILAERRGFRDVRKNLVGKSKGRVVEL